MAHSIAKSLFLTLIFLIGIGNPLIGSGYHYSYTFPDKTNNYILPLLGCATAALIYCGMGYSNNCAIDEMIKSKTTELDAASTNLELAQQVINNDWKKNLKNQYESFDYAREDNNLMPLQEIREPQAIEKLNIKIQDNVWLRTIRNYFGTCMTIDKSHRKADKVKTLKGQIKTYNDNPLFSKHISEINSYLASMRLHNAWVPVYTRHASSMAGYATYTQTKKQNENSLYPPYVQDDSSTQQQVICALPDNVATSLVAECNTSQSNYPYYTAARKLGDETDTMARHLDSFHSNGLVKDDQTEMVMYKKIQVGNKFLENMNVLLKNMPEYTIQLRDYNDQELKNKSVQLQQQLAENERIKALAEKNLSDAEIRRKRAEEQKLEEEAAYTRTQNRALKREKNIKDSPCEIQ